MADWISLLVQIGATGAVLVIAVGVMGRWLWRKIDTAVNAYTGKYLEQKATIDARIANLEKLVEEQARLTRTVESIKDEIAAQRKSRDNRWEFRKDIYVRLITSATEIMGLYSFILSFRRTLETQMSDEHRKELTEMKRKAYSDLDLKGREFRLAITLAPLATADATLRPFMDSSIFPGTNPDSPEYNDAIQDAIKHLNVLLAKLYHAGREDLWGTPEPEATAGPAA